MADKTSYIETNKPLYIKNLVARMDRNEKLGERDFEEWVFSHLELAPGCDVMDVACGNGKAIFKLLERNPELGRVVGIDFAEPAIEMLRQRAVDEGRENVEAHVLDMETLATALAGEQLDHIFSIYGVHYSPRVHEMLCDYKPLLAPGGSIFFCGPDGFCNTKLMRMLVAADDVGGDPIPERMLRPFISEAQLDHLRLNFEQVALDRFENLVHFADFDTFLGWWVNHDLFRESLVEPVKEEVEREIAETGSFTLNKNVLGVSLS